MIRILYSILYLSILLFIVIFLQTQEVFHEGMEFEGKKFVCEDAAIVDSQLKCSFISMDVEVEEEEEEEE